MVNLKNKSVFVSLTILFAGMLLILVALSPNVKEAEQMASVGLIDPKNTTMDFGLEVLHGK